MIRTIEELALNAWPSLQVVLVDGWVLRFANGYTRRSNSVNPLYPSCHPLAEKVAICERLYRGKGLKPVFKMTAASCPEDLDAFLAAQGYQTEALTSVKTMDLNNWELSRIPAIGLAEAIPEEWFGAFCRMSGLASRHHSTAWQVLRSIVPVAGFASISHDRESIACGLGVVQGGHVGLFDVVTDTRYRRQGYGQRMVQGLLSGGGAR